MAQDIRTLFKEDRNENAIHMSQGHETRFLEKLDAEFPKQKTPKRRFNYLNIAASVVLLLGLAYTLINIPGSKSSGVNTNPDKVIVKQELKSFGEFSPDLKKVEDFYLASINLQLSKIQLTPDNKELVDGYMERLKELNDEYDTLTVELNDNGLNQATLNALIDNLKFRLNLLMRLKEKLEEYNNDTFASEQI